MPYKIIQRYGIGARVQVQTAGHSRSKCASLDQIKDAAAAEGYVGPVLNAWCRSVVQPAQV